MKTQIFTCPTIVTMLIGDRVRVVAEYLCQSALLDQVAFGMTLPHPETMCTDVPISSYGLGIGSPDFNTIVPEWLVDTLGRVSILDVPSQGWCKQWRDWQFLL